MQQPARLPEIFDQISVEHPVLEFGSRTSPPPDNWNCSQSPKSDLTQNTPLPPRKWKTLTFFPEFKYEFTQNTPHPPPPKMKNTNFLSRVQSELTQNTPPPPKIKNS